MASSRVAFPLFGLSSFPVREGFAVLPVHRRHTTTLLASIGCRRPFAGPRTPSFIRRSASWDSQCSMSVRLDSNNPERYRELLEKYDTWMLDCDGVLWHDDRLIDGAVEFLEILRSQST